MAITIKQVLSSSVCKGAAMPEVMPQPRPNNAVSECLLWVCRLGGAKRRQLLRRRILLGCRLVSGVAHTHLDEEERCQRQSWSDCDQERSRYPRVHA